MALQNYRAFPTFEQFWEHVIDGVQPEWLQGTRFGTELKTTLQFLHQSAERATVDFLPPPHYILEPMKWLKPSQVRVILTAQDPYPNPRHAVGIAFHSTASDCPHSARRINQNLIKYGHIPSECEEVSDYRSWLSQGVLMTNVSLTTKAGESGAHGAIWKNIMQQAFQLVPKKSVALLLGRDAQSIMSALGSLHKVEHAHPAARNDEFYEKDVFGEVNACLRQMKLPPIDWTPGPPA